MSGECDRHSECMERIHESLNQIKISNATTEGKIEGFMQSINEFVGAVRKDIYAKDGIMGRVGSTSNQVNLQWGILSTLILGIIATFIAVIIKK